MALLSLRSTADPTARGLDAVAVEQLTLQSIEALVEIAAGSLGTTGRGPTASAPADSTEDQDLAGLASAAEDSILVTQTDPASPTPLPRTDRPRESFTVGLRDADISSGSIADVLYWKQALGS